MIIENTVKTFISNGDKIAKTFFKRCEGNIETIFGHNKALKESFSYCPLKKQN
jgi:phage-related protein